MSDPKKDEQLNKKALGKDGVTASPYDLPADKDTYKKVKEAKKPQNVPTPTAPDDQENTQRSQTNNMNEHLNQSVPPDFG